MKTRVPHGTSKLSDRGPEFSSSSLSSRLDPKALKPATLSLCPSHRDPQGHSHGRRTPWGLSWEAVAGLVGPQGRGQAQAPWGLEGRSQGHSAEGSEGETLWPVNEAWAGGWARSSCLSGALSARLSVEASSVGGSDRDTCWEVGGVSEGGPGAKARVRHHSNLTPPLAFDLVF